MYTPASFAVNDEKCIHEFLRSHPFAQLSSFDGQEPVVSHLPLLLDQSSGRKGQLWGHVAKANSQWKHADGKIVLAVFSGPHAYISASWYETPKSVPTWNYTAVHVYGQLRVVTEKQQLREIVNQLVRVMEQNLQNPWTMEHAGDDFVDQLLNMIVGFTIDIERIEAKFKLSQNHTEPRRRLVVDALQKRSDENSQRIAELMEAQFSNERSLTANLPGT